ncbi:chemotaxis protein CheX [Paenibacillus aurantius]|uniref:Chemotaxis protein CheX n=1 Tax=Paenibacillus aurantius TaxID=2918900 RepID=A0AA96LHF8_9BACL|nr:chemotaxis protein CheX [Paenibacillus aurantius]WJH36761.1 chemotaxis protein CheX [Paenibacillus sp. CC-CFT747]WNQ12125.1 chemotaxis protein CheX [Paenibacillus aurantius]
MKAAYINPFLSSSVHVIESLIQIRPSLGELNIKYIDFWDDYVWLRIGIVGEMKGDIVFGFPEKVALRIASGMMGGYVLTEFDEMSRSAISELGNMISGNASTQLSNQGISIDITPPSFLEKSSADQKKAFSVPLRLENIGEFDIYVIA